MLGRFNYLPLYIRLLILVSGVSLAATYWTYKFYIPHYQKIENSNKKISSLNEDINSFKSLKGKNFSFIYDNQLFKEELMGDSLSITLSEKSKKSIQLLTLGKKKGLMDYLTQEENKRGRRRRRGEEEEIAKPEISQEVETVMQEMGKKNPILAAQEMHIKQRGSFLYIYDLLKNLDEKSLNVFWKEIVIDANDYPEVDSEIKFYVISEYKKS